MGIGDIGGARMVRKHHGGMNVPDEACQECDGAKFLA